MKPLKKKRKPKLPRVAVPKPSIAHKTKKKPGVRKKKVPVEELFELDLGEDDGF